MNNLSRLVSIFSKSKNAPFIRYITVVLKSNIDEIPSLAEACAKKYFANGHKIRYVYEKFNEFSKLFSIEWKKENLVVNERCGDLQKYADQCPFKLSVICPPSNYFKDDGEPYSKNSQIIQKKLNHFKSLHMLRDGLSILLNITRSFFKQLVVWLPWRNKGHIKIHLRINSKGLIELRAKRKFYDINNIEKPYDFLKIKNILK